MTVQHINPKEVHIQPECVIRQKAVTRSKTKGTKKHGHSKTNSKPTHTFRQVSLDILGQLSMMKPLF